MNVDRYLRMIAGAFVLLSLALGHWVSPYWYLFTAFVGLNARNRISAPAGPGHYAGCRAEVCRVRYPSCGYYRSP
jgi:hypothetical protein